MKKLLLIIFIPLMLFGCAAPPEQLDSASTSQNAHTSPEGSASTPVTSAPAASPSPDYSNAQKLYINASRANILDAPDGTAMATLNMGQQVVVIDSVDDYSLILYEEQQGYINSSLLSEEQYELDSYDIDLTNAKTPQIKVYKARRILEVWDSKKRLAMFPIGLGRVPEGDKHKEGDKKTPEGEYYVCTRNDKSRYYLSLGLSYPSIKDAKAGLDSGLIDKDTSDKIKAAINNKKQPPWNTPLGGEIMIHGKGSATDWTLGCIAVNNDVMDVLWPICKIGTKVTVYK